MKINVVLFDLPEQKLVPGLDAESFVELGDNSLRVAYKAVFSEPHEETSVWEERSRSYEIVVKRESVAGAVLNR